MKHVFPWFIKPGGRSAFLSFSSRTFRALYNSCGVGAFCFAIVGNVCVKTW